MERASANIVSRRAVLRVLGTSAAGLAAAMCLRVPWFGRRIGTSAVRDLDARYCSDEHFAMHSRQVGAFASKICELLQVSKGETRTIVKAAQLHDIGMIAVPDTILRKTSCLTSHETAIMRRHCRFGFELLSRTGVYEEEAEIVLAHHENFNGSGYPRALAGEAIPFGARIIHVADAIAARTENAHAWNRKHALVRIIYELNKHSNTIFDPRIVRALSAGALEAI